MEEPHLSLREAAQRLDISERTARRWIKSGKLRAYKPGRDYWIPESAIKEVVEASKVRPKASGRSSLEPSLFNGLEEEQRDCREEAEEFIRDHKPLLDDESLTVAVSGKLAQRAAARLTEVREKFNEANQDENFPLAELNDLDNALQMLIGFTTEVIGNHERRFGVEVDERLKLVADNTRGVA